MSKRKEIEDAASYRKLHGHDKYPGKGKSSFWWKLLVIIAIIILVISLLRD